MQMKDSIKKQKKFLSIKYRLIFIVIPTIILFISVIIAAAYITTKNIIIENGMNELTVKSDMNTEQVELWTDSILTTLNTVKSALDTLDITNEERLDYLKTTMSIDESFPSGVYIGNGKGEFLDPSGWVPPSTYVVTDRDWYKEGITHNEFMLGITYVDEETGEYVVSASTKLSNQKGMVEVAATDIFLTKLSDIVALMNMKESGLSFIVDRNNYSILAHKDKSFISTNITDTENPLLSTFHSYIQNNITEVFNVTIDGITYMSKIDNINGTPWTMVTYVPESEVLSQLNTIQVVLSSLAIVFILLIIVVIERAIHIIIRPIRGITSSITQITDGDFTVDVKDAGSNEVGLMATGMQKFIKTMVAMIREVKSIIQVLKEQATNSNDITKNLYESVTLQETSMSELKITVEELTKATIVIAENATELATVSSGAAIKANEVNEKMDDTVNTAKRGQKDMEGVKVSMSGVQGSIEVLETSVVEVGDSMKEINNIVQLIGEIASQTNLLALNAAIEAARAGEAGKGFAIVAEEIRKLAETSSSAVSNIGALVTSINELVDNTILNAKESVSYIKESSDVVNTASITFTSIYDNVTKANSLVDNMIEDIKIVDSVATTVASITEEQSAGAEEILATTENLLDHTSMISKNSKILEVDANNLSLTARKLNEQMELFKI